MRRQAAILFAGAILLATTAAGLDAKEYEHRRAIDELVLPLIDTGTIIGLVVGVVDGEQEHVCGYGRVAHDSEISPDGTTVFEIGALTQVFCGLLLALMAEEGTLELEDPVGQYLPGFMIVPDFEGHEIRLLDLATHTSGLPRLPHNLGTTDLKNPYANYSERLMFEFLAEYALPREPGTQYEFSNIGMGFLGYLLARMENTGFEELVVARICKPLGMKNTRATFGKSQTARLARGYDADGNPAPRWEFPALEAAGCLYSTVDGMLSFVSSNLGRNATSLTQAMEITHLPRHDISAAGDKIGLAWNIQPGGVIWHNGQTSGYHSFAGFIPELGIGVVVLSNSASMIIDKLGLSILKTMTGETAEPLDVKAPVRVAPETLDSYAGRYELPSGAVLEVALEGMTLVLRLPDQRVFRVYAESDTEFFLRAADVTLLFLVDEDTGEATHLIWTQGPNEAAARRIE